MKNHSWLVATLVGATLLSAGASRALAASLDYNDSSQVQPYIEKLKQKHGIKERAPEPEAAPDASKYDPAPSQAGDLSNPQSVQPYIEKLREQGGLPPSSLEQPKQELPANPGDARAKDVQPYIETLKAGKELEPKYKKPVDQAAGFAVVASNRFKLQSDKVQANTFESVYTPDEKYSPSVDLFYEKHLYRNHYVGAIGIVGHLNIMTTKGKGVFTRSGTPSSDTEFRFLAFPVSIGGVYRFTQLRFVQPFVELGAAGIPFIETRNDNLPSRKAISRGYHAMFGFALNLDWIGRKNAWDQYDMNGVLHTYMVVQAEYLRTLSGPVSFGYDGYYAGLMFEF